MDKIITTPSKNIALNLSQLRKKKNLSQQGLSKLSGVTRASIAQLETGTSNPSLEILLKLSAALQVSIDEFIANPMADIEFIKSKDIPIDRKSKDGILIKKLLPHPIPSTAIEEIRLDPNTTLTGAPHIEGTREYFVCIKGEFLISVAGERFELKKGDVLNFPGNRLHSYKNTNSMVAQGISVVLFAIN